MLALRSRGVSLGYKPGSPWCRIILRLKGNPVPTSYGMLGNSENGCKKWGKWQAVGGMDGVGVVQRIFVVGALTRCDRSFLEIAVFAFSVFSVFLYLRSYEKGWSGCQIIL